MLRSELTLAWLQSICLLAAHLQFGLHPPKPVFVWVLSALTRRPPTMSTPIIQYLLALLLEGFIHRANLRPEAKIILSHNNHRCACIYSPSCYVVGAGEQLACRSDLLPKAPMSTGPGPSQQQLTNKMHIVVFFKDRSARHDNLHELVSFFVARFDLSKA